MLGYFQVLLICFWSVQLCQIAKSTLLFFCLANLILLIWAVHMAKLSSSRCHVCIPKSPTLNPNYKVHCTLRTAWNEIQTAHKYKYFWGCIMPKFVFQSAETSAPKTHTAPKTSVSHWWLLSERLALWKFVHQIASMKLHPFPHWKSTNVIWQMFIDGIRLLMQ